MTGTHNNLYNNSFNTKTNIQMGSNSMRNIWWNVQEFEIPGISMSPSRQNTRAGANLLFAPDTAVYDDLSLTIILDKDFKVYDSLYAFFVERLNIETGTFEKEGFFDIWVQVYDGEGNPVKKFTFYDCRLINFGGVQYSSTDQEDSINAITITIEYLYFDYDNCFLKLHKPNECELQFPHG